MGFCNIGAGRFYLHLQQLDDLVFNSKVTQVDFLDIAASIEEFKNLTAAFLGGPPKIEKIKFTPISIRP